MRLSIQKLGPYLWRYRRGVALGMGALVMKDIFNACQPLVFGRAVDALTHGIALPNILKYAGILIALSAVKGLFQYWMRVILIGMSRDVEFDLRNDIFSHLITLSSNFYSRFRTGDIMARATNDLNAVRMMVGPGLMYWTETMLTIVIVVIIMAFVDLPMTLVALLPAPIVSAVVIYFGRMIHTRFERIQGMFASISSRVQENLAGVRVIRAYVQEKHELRRFEVLNHEFIRENISLARASGMFMPLLQSLIGVAFLVVLWVGGLRLLSGKISIGDFVMFNMYMGMLSWPMIALGWVVNLMERGNASLARIYDMMGERPAIADPAQPRTIPSGPADIEFRTVSAFIVKGVSLTIRSGETIAIAGHTGSGKTTLVQMIPRLIDPTEGAVLLGGIDIRDLSVHDVRARIGFVPQETFLFSATLGENIAWGVKNATREQIERAAELAGLATDIAGFPNGYDTVVGERGITLSGGQKQRTAIARAILRDPEILILDDALSSVDTLTEERILTGLQSLMHNRTTILISHRVSTLRNADRIIVVEHGQIVEQGTHSELLEQGGYYADLYQKQLLEEELETI